MKAGLNSFLNRIASLAPEVSDVRAALVTLLISLLTVAGLGLTESAYATTNLDLFYDNAVMPEGPFAGEKLNNKDLRTAVNLTGTEFENHYGRRSGYVLVGNFFHNGEQHIARIPVRDIEQTSFVFDYFTQKNTTAHTMVMFEFTQENPIELLARQPNQVEIAQGSFGDAFEKPIHIHEMLFSAEAITKVGDSYNMKRGLKNHFALTYRLMSLHSRFLKTLKSDPNRGQFEVYALEMSGLERSHALMRALQMATRHKMNNMYHTIKNNCVNTALNVLGWQIDEADGILSKAVLSFPLFVKLELKRPGAPGGRVLVRETIDRIAYICRFDEICLRLLSR